jgi:hypothetical protein
MNLKRDFIWILLFGTLIGLNESVLGSAFIPYKSVILSVITLLFLSMARSVLPYIGTSLMITAIAVLFKMADMGVVFCKPAALVMLGVSFEIFASVLLRKQNPKLFSYSLTNFLAAFVAFICFAVMERYIVRNEYWNVSKFNSYILIRGSLTAFASAGIAVLGLQAIKPLMTWYNKLLNNKVTILNGVMGGVIAVVWIMGYFID